MSINEYPALNGEVVTERHARICRERGHATHTVDGKDTGICPRCGDVKKVKTHPEVGEKYFFNHGHNILQGTVTKVSHSLLDVTLKTEDGTEHEMSTKAIFETRGEALNWDSYAVEGW